MNSPSQSTAMFPSMDLGPIKMAKFLCIFQWFLKQWLFSFMIFNLKRSSACYIRNSHTYIKFYYMQKKIIIPDTFLKWNIARVRYWSFQWLVPDYPLWNGKLSVFLFLSCSIVFIISNRRILIMHLVFKMLRASWGHGGSDLQS